MHDHPRSNKDTPTARPKNRGPSHCQADHKIVPSTKVATPSNTAQGHAGNFRRKAATTRKRPTTVKNEPRRSIEAKTPAEGCAAIKSPIGNPAIPGIRCKKNALLRLTRKA